MFVLILCKRADVNHLCSLLMLMLLCCVTATAETFIHISGQMTSPSGRFWVTLFTMHAVHISCKLHFVACMSSGHTS